MRTKLRTRFFLTIGCTCVVVALAIGWASRRAASEGFRMIFDSEAGGGEFDPSRDMLHAEDGVELPEHLSGLELHEEAQHTFDRSLLAAVLLIGAAAGLATFLLSRWIVGPLERLTEHARRLGAGQLDKAPDSERSDELGELGRTLNQLATDLNHTEGLRRSLVQDVAHELRTPLTVMRGQVEALQDGLLQPEPQVLAALHAHVMQLNHIVEDLQELALAEAGQLSIKLTDVDLEGQVRELTTSLDTATGLPLIHSDLAGLPLVRADPARVRQVLGNLVSNARRHAPADSTVRISARFTNERVELLVRDDGQGLASEDLERVFERFYRTDSSRERATGGVGLGLPIARRIAEAQGGDLRLESQVGQGLTAIFGLPRTSASS